MTREEQIKQMAKKYATTEEKLAAIEGAKWADGNPASPWISVKDRMPEDGQFILFTYYLTKEDLTVYRVRHYSRKYPDAETLSMQRWMPIPELPKEDGL